MTVLAVMRKARGKNGKLNEESFELFVEQPSLGKTNKVGLIRKSQMSLFKKTLEENARVLPSLITVEITRFKHPEVHPNNKVWLSLDLKAYLELYEQVVKNC